MKDDRKITRRRFLKIAGGLLGGGILMCGGGAYLGLQTPASVRFQQFACGEREGKCFLVAYASKCGATGEIAEKIAQNLCEGGVSVDLLRARDVQSLADYSAVVLGTAVYMGKPLNEALDFAEDFLAAASDLPVALFDVCLTLKEKTPDNVQTALSYLDGFHQFFTPRLVAMFAGRIDYSTLPFLYRTFAQADKEGILAEGDYRDWQAVDDWGSRLSDIFNL